MNLGLAKRIKERVNIIDVIGSYIKVTKAGINHKACCPFHNEKTPSFFISEQRQTFTCFGCGVKGDVIEFVQQYEHMDFREALRLVFDKSGLPESDWEESKEKSAAHKEEDEQKKRSGIALQKAIEVYQKELKEDTVPSKKARAYLERRGLKQEMIDEWQIGYAPEMWQFVEIRVRADASVVQKDLLGAGLIKMSDKQPGQSYDFFRGRITFPIFDINGKAVGISARIVDVGEPKYLNSPDTALFNKSETLYGLHKAKEGIRKFKYALLVEGQMDLLLCHQEGFDNAVATSGTSLTEKHVHTLRRFTNNLMLVYDADQAGLKATIRAWTLALAQGLEVKVAVLPRGEDPASLLYDKKQIFMKALKEAMHVIEYVLSQSDVRSRSGKKDALEKLIPLLNSLDNSVDREFFVKKVSDMFDMTPDSIQIELHRYQHEIQKQGNHSGVDAAHILHEQSLQVAGDKAQFELTPIRKALAELRSLVYICSQQLHTLHTQSGSTTLYPDIYKKVQTDIETYRQGGLGLVQKEFFNEITSDIEQLYTELTQEHINPDEQIVFRLEALFGQKDPDIDFYIREVQVGYLYMLQKIYTVVFDRVQKELKQAELVKDTARIETLIPHIHTLSLYKQQTF